MAVEPTLDVMTKLRLGAFASEMAVKHPAQAKTIFSLQETLEKRLPLDVQNKIIEKLNKDPKGTLAAAEKLIAKDPTILDEVNKNPLKLATIMGVEGVKPAAPVVTTTAAAPAQTTAAPAPAGAANAPAAAKSESAKTAPAKAEPVTVVAAPPAQPISDAELALRTKLGEESVKITKMPGFEEFAARAEKSQSLTQAMNAMMGKDAKTPQDALKALQEMQKDPEFFVKANKGIDEIPEQMRDNVFTQIAENPQLGRDALSGDAAAKNRLTMSAMFGGLFGGSGGPGGKGGFDLGSMLSGGGGFGAILSNILPMLINGIKNMIGSLTGNAAKFASVPAITTYGNGDGAVIGRFSQSVDRALGTDSSKKPVYDATKPDQAPTPMAQLGQPKPEIATPAPGTNGPDVALLDQRKIQGPGSGPGAGSLA